MYESKKMNVMRTNTLTPGVEWCNEAFEKADVIVYDNLFFKKEKLEPNNNSIYFSSITIIDTTITFRRLMVVKNTTRLKLLIRSIDVK